MKDKDEPKRPTICSHQEAERPTPSSQQITHHRHPHKTAAVLLDAFLHNSSPLPSQGPGDKNTLCLAAGRDITQGRLKPQQDLQACRLVRRRGLHLFLTAGGEVQWGAGLGKGVMTTAARRNIFNRRCYQ